MIRRIVDIDEKKCNGCGLCVHACHEGAIELRDGKAVLISDEYCDGLGDCLPECPTDAIKIIERESLEYNEELVMKKIAEKKQAVKENSLPCGCPGTMAKKIERKNPVEETKLDCGCPGTSAKKIERKSLNVLSDIKPMKKVSTDSTSTSELNQWPVQLRLINTQAPYLKGANLLVAADCTAYAFADFHKEFIKNHITVIGCPKLDDIKYYEEKLAEIIKVNDLKSITVVRMEVPCCAGIVNAVKKAMLDAQTIVPYREVTISTDGNIL
ncbi:4Fe-4S binding protein [Clostridium sp. CX1]|uniref:ATP-binding protein n=1 Tax=Clostridium sp. CX1 TaxID=2978346 RepID=UPI0021C12BDB|nr:4Fe-4S binding protein [Clostridium sp. CX1]MCT8975397.1 4Fe-4S binding protein [Clostridium sp. CX1]